MIAEISHHNYLLSSRITQNKIILLGKLDLGVSWPRQIMIQFATDENKRLELDMDRLSLAAHEEKIVKDLNTGWF